MKTYILSCIILLLSFLLTSCNKDSVISQVGEEGRASLGIITQFTDSPVITRAAISNFPAGSQLGLYITSGDIQSPYCGLNSNMNVRALYNSGRWSLSPTIYLSSEPAVIYAYYPYSSANLNGTSCPVNSDSQIDYLYGTHTTGQSAINNGNPVVNLTMRHALSLVQFNIKKSNYPGTGKLTKIEIANSTGKTKLYNEGLLNIRSGSIIYTTGKNKAATISNDAGLYYLGETFPTNENQCPSVLVLPVNALDQDGEVVINFTIDSKVYTYRLPAGTIWRGGTKNIYSVTLNGSGLVIGNVVIQDWTTGITGSVTLQ